MATTRWLGGAVDIAQRVTITIAGSWSTSNTVTLTCGGNDLVVTVGGDTGTADIAEILSKAINASSRTDNLKGAESRNVGGQEINELTEVTATVSGSVVTITANTSGKPFTVTVAETASGSATLATPQAATGANFWSNVDNWSAGSAPSNGDTVIFDNGEVDVLYGLTSAIQPAVFTRTASYTGMIGLHERNTDGQPYDEYRTTHLTFTNDGGTAACAVNLAGGGSRTKIDFGNAGNVTVHVTDRTQREDQGVPEILLKGTETDNTINVIRGDVGLGFYSEATTWKMIRAGFDEDRDGDVDIWCGDGVSLVEIQKDGGTVHVSSNFATLTQKAGEIIVEGAAVASGAQKFYGGF